jgi:hypothetical protein
MIRFWRRAQDLVGRMLFCVIVLVTMGVDRLSQGGHILTQVAAESELEPQQSLVRLITLLIAGSLSMMALGYRARG